MLHGLESEELENTVHMKAKQGLMKNEKIMNGDSEEAIRKEHWMKRMKQQNKHWNHTRCHKGVMGRNE